MVSQLTPSPVAGHVDWTGFTTTTMRLTGLSVHVALGTEHDAYGVVVVTYGRQLPVVGLVPEVYAGR